MDRKLLIESLSNFPKNLAEIAKSLNEADLNKVHKDSQAEWVVNGDFTTAQMVNHIADAHMTKIFQIRHALIEDAPDLIEYQERFFTDLKDGADVDLEASLSIISGVHSRVVKLLKSLKDDQWEREAIHPKSNVTIKQMAERFLAHGNFHLEQIKRLTNLFELRSVARSK